MVLNQRCYNFNFPWLFFQNVKFPCLKIKFPDVSLTLTIFSLTISWSKWWCCFRGEFKAGWIRNTFKMSLCVKKKQTKISVLSQVDMYFYYVLHVDISVIKPWLKMIAVKWYDIIISLQWNDIISLHGLNCPIKNLFINGLNQSGCKLYFSWRQLWR